MRGSGSAIANAVTCWHLLVDLMTEAEEIVILNTWIPELNILDGMR